MRGKIREIKAPSYRLYGSPFLKPMNHPTSADQVNKHFSPGSAGGGTDGEWGNSGGLAGCCLNWMDACGKGMYTGKTERRFYGKEGKERKCVKSVAVVVMECRRKCYVCVRKCVCGCRCETGVKQRREKIPKIKLSVVYFLAQIFFHF